MRAQPLSCCERGGPPYVAHQTLPFLTPLYSSSILVAHSSCILLQGDHRLSAEPEFRAILCFRRFLKAVLFWNNNSATYQQWPIRPIIIRCSRSWGVSVAHLFLLRSIANDCAGGSFGVVYKAIEKSTGDLVAIKHVRTMSQYSSNFYNINRALDRSRRHLRRASRNPTRNRPPQYLQ